VPLCQRHIKLCYIF